MPRQVTDCGSLSGRDEYMELIHRFPLKPIADDAMLEDASAMADCLLESEELSVDAESYLNVLTKLIEDYEAEHHPIPPADDADVMRHLMDAKGVRAADVARETGIVESTISAVMNGKRSLNRQQIGKLMAYFHVESGVFAYPAS